MVLNVFKNYADAPIDSLIARKEWLNQYVINLDEIIRVKFLIYIEGLNLPEYYPKPPKFKEVFKLKKLSKQINNISLMTEIQSIEILLNNKLEFLRKLQTYIDKIYKGYNNE